MKVFNIIFQEVLDFKISVCVCVRAHIYHIRNIRIPGSSSLCQ